MHIHCIISCSSYNVAYRTLISTVAASPPRNVTFKQVGHTVMVSWLPPSDGATPTGYSIHYSLPENDENVITIDNPSQSREVFTEVIAGLEPGYEYTFYLKTLSSTLPSVTTTQFRVKSRSLLITLLAILAYNTHSCCIRVFFKYYMH